MRRHHSLIATVVAALAVTSCATTMTVSSHVERGLDFSPYRTFAWGPADALPTGDPRLDQDPFFKDHLQGAVEKQLAQRGLALSPEGAPDLLVHYHASVTQEIDVVDRDSLSTYCDSDECRPSVYDAGTLFVDLVDARTNTLLWRGWAQGSIDGVIDDQAWMESRIDEAIARILQRLPGRL